MTDIETSNNTIAAKYYRDVLQRIGANPAANLKWLLRFSRLDLERLDQQGWEKLADEIITFTNLGYWQSMGFLRTHKDMQLLANTQMEETRHILEHDFKNQWAIYFQKLVKRTLEELSWSHMTLIPTVAADRYVWGSKTGGGVYYPPGTSPKVPFNERLVAVLKEAGWRLGYCAAKDCKTHQFIKYKRGQRYCTNACRSRVAMREMRAHQRKRAKHSVGKKGRRPKQGGPKHGTKRR